MLPIRKVVLYKHGVGYFERQGEVEGDASVDLHFKSGEMNDVLKSLTTLDLSGGIISSVSYESVLPVDRQLADISVRVPESNALSGLLSQIQGAKVKVLVGSETIDGVVAGIEPVTRREHGETLVHPHLALVVDGGTFRTVDLLEVKSVTLMEENLRRDLQHLFDVLVSSKKKELKKLTLFAKGKGKREILAGYVVETPVWKTSYRLLLGSKKTKIQGWALVDNTQDEDWENVSLTLVSGLPVSFVHNLYSPRYKRRPVVEVDEEEAYAPPVLEEGVAVAAMEPEYAPSEVAAAPKSKRSAAAGMAPAEKAARDEARESSMEVRTRTAETGDLFQYEISNPVTVKRDQSALVPIVYGDFDGRRVAIYNPDVRETNPMSAVLMKNSTGLTLEGGPATVLEDETYVGEAMMESMKPDEEQLLPFSVELGCTVKIDPVSESRDVHFVRIAHGTLYLHRYRIEKRIYEVQNRTARTIDLFLDHRFLPGYKLEETDRPVKTTDHFHRFRFDVPAKKTVKFVVSEKGDEEESFELASVNRDQIRLWLTNCYIDKRTTEVLQDLAERSERITELETKTHQREQEVQTITSNHERLRKNIVTLGVAQDEKKLRERYVATLAKEEDRLQQIQEEIRQMREEKIKLEQELRTRVAKISFEASL